MPKLHNNPLADFDGQLGRLVFYHFKGKPCVRRTPVREKEFTPPEVKNQSRFGLKVVIADRAKAVVEEGPAAMENDGVSWWYPAKLDLPPDQPLWITVTAADQPGNRTTRTLRHTTGA